MSTRTDGFWKILTPEQAWHIHKNENIELYILYEDGSESLVYQDEDDALQEAIDLNISIGIEAAEVCNLQNKSILWTHKSNHICLITWVYIM